MRPAAALALAAAAMHACPAAGSPVAVAFAKTHKTGGSSVTAVLHRLGLNYGWRMPVWSRAHCRPGKRIVVCPAGHGTSPAACRAPRVAACDRLRMNSTMPGRGPHAYDIWCVRPAHGACTRRRMVARRRMAHASSLPPPAGHLAACSNSYRQTSCLPLRAPAHQATSHGFHRRRRGGAGGRAACEYHLDDRSGPSKPVLVCRQFLQRLEPATGKAQPGRGRGSCALAVARTLPPLGMMA